MLAASTNYIEALKTNPGSWRADYAKLIIEAHSAVPALIRTTDF